MSYNITKNDIKLNQQDLLAMNTRNLISRQNLNELSGSDIKRAVKHMTANGF